MKHTGMPIVEVDYCFIGNTSRGETPATLAAVARPSGHGFSHMVQKKGRGDGPTVQSLVRWMNHVGLNGDIRLRCDPEASVMAFVQEVAARRAPAATLVEQTPVASPSSKVKVERFIQSSGGLVRALTMRVEERWHVEVTPTSAIYPWIIMHGAWLYSRFQPLGEHHPCG